MAYNLKKLGLRRSAPDARDRLYTSADFNPKKLVDLREWDSDMEDQENLGSCVGHAITTAYEVMLRIQYPDKFVELSRLFVYYNARLLENSVNEDVGATMRKALKGTEKYGLCTEALWPYDPAKFTVEPPDKCYVDGLTRTVRNYRSLDNSEDMFKVLGDNTPVLIGCSVYDSFYDVDINNPIIPLPTTNDNYAGEHAMCVLGYDLEKKLFLIKNSFGTSWGFEGYAWLPFKYTKEQVFERWCFDINLKK